MICIRIVSIQRSFSLQVFNEKKRPEADSIENRMIFLSFERILKKLFLFSARNSPWLCANEDMIDARGSRGSNEMQMKFHAIQQSIINRSTENKQILIRNRECWE